MKKIKRPTPRISLQIDIYAAEIVSLRACRYLAECSEDELSIFMFQFI